MSFWDEKSEKTASFRAIVDQQLEISFNVIEKEIPILRQEMCKVDTAELMSRYAETLLSVNVPFPTFWLERYAQALCYIAKHCVEIPRGLDENEV